MRVDSRARRLHQHVLSSASSCSRRAVWGGSQVQGASARRMQLFKVNAKSYCTHAARTLLPALGCRLLSWGVTCQSLGAAGLVHVVEEQTSFVVRVGCDGRHPHAQVCALTCSNGPKHSLIACGLLWSDRLAVSVHASVAMFRPACMGTGRGYAGERASIME